MKQCLIYILFLQSALAYSQTDYDLFFTNKRYRLDYTIAGNFAEASISPGDLHQESIWSGSHRNLIDTFQYGKYLLTITDIGEKLIIYSHGYNNLFSEWQLTADAKINHKAYQECVMFPAPKGDFLITLSEKDSTLSYRDIFTMEVNVDDVNIHKENSLNTSKKVILNSGNFDRSLDIVFFAEGYSQAEEDMFYDDAMNYSSYLFKYKPFSEFKDKINIVAVFVPSEDSGVDIPHENIWRNTVGGAHFNTFNVDRYLTLPDITEVYKYLSEYPVDQLCILANTTKYGGGGIYNFYNIFAAHNEKSEYIFIHEFGHGFAGLADEYFSSEVPYEETGNLNYEPCEPNITTLVEFEKKWADFVPDTVPVPTPNDIKYKNVVGVFQGANYSAKNYYRPYLNCIMRTLSFREFCPVCQRSIEEMIKSYTE